MIKMELSKYEALALLRALSKANAVGRLCDAGCPETVYRLCARLELAFAGKAGQPWKEGLKLALAAGKLGWKDAEKIYLDWYRGKAVA